MTNRKKNNLQKQRNMLIGWEVLLLLGVALVSSGLFLEHQVVPFAVVVSSLILIIIIYKTLTKQHPNHLPTMTLFFSCIAISYVPSLFDAVSIEYTLIKIVEWLVYGLVLLIIPSLFYQNSKKMMIYFSVMFTTLHLLVFLQFIPVQDGIYLLNEQFSGSGVRLAGFLQYPNATATIIGALILYLLIHYIEQTETKNVQIIQYSTVLCLSFLFFMTESRGAWFVFAICFVLATFLMNEQKQLTFFLHTGCTLLFGLICYSVMSAVGSQLFTFLIIGCAIGAGLIVQKFTHKIQWQLPSKWIFPSLFTLFVLAISYAVFTKSSILNILPNALQHRLTMGSATLYDRLIYMKDGLIAIRSNFFFGAGGEAWRYKMYEVQSAPYVVSDIHSFYVQHLLEVGAIGLLIMLIGIIYGIVFVCKRNPLLLPPIFMILLHSGFEFSMSYGFTLLLLAILFLEGFEEKGFISLNSSKKRNGSMIVCTVIAIFCLLPSFLWGKANEHYEAAVATQSVERMNEAIHKNPFASRFYLAKAQMVGPEDQVDVLTTALSYEPSHSLLYFHLGEAQFALGHYEQAIENFELSLKYDRFDREKYHRIIARLQSDELNGMSDFETFYNNVLQQLHIYEQLAQSSSIRDQRSFLRENE